MWWGRYFNLLLLWLMYITSHSLHIGVCGEGEFLETKPLIDFIRSIDPKNHLFSWIGSVPDLCSDQWSGIKCDFHTRHITEIKLENLNLSGILDADSLCKLKSLQVLSLAKNLIRGTIPDSISNCMSLTHLNLSNNLLHGMVPFSLTELTNLRSLDISNNNFSTSLQNFAQELESEHPDIMESSVVDSGSNLNKDGNKTNSKGFGWEGTWLLLLICLGLFLLFVFFLHKRVANLVKEEKIPCSLEDSSIKISAVKDGEETKPGEESSELVFFAKESERFKIEDLLESAADLQGQSLCSSLYKVRLKNNAIFAVKRLKKLQVSFEEFGETMREIGNLKHPNILSPVAYHSSTEEKLLIYRYQKNGSLLNLLENYAEGKRDFRWRLRLSIAHGIAQGLDFLHRRSCGGKNVVHGNLKLSNILLTENEEPLISEYGFQRFLDPKRACLYSSNGYRAPEKELTEQADVFSFGVILLELLTGKTVERSGLDLPKWVKSMVREEWTGEVFDKEVNKEGKQWAFPLLNVALNCVSQSPENRPNISEVLDKIEEAVNEQEDFSFSSTSSVESNQQDSCLLHTVIPETWETPGSNP